MAEIFRICFSMIPTNGQNLKEIDRYQFQTLDEVDWTDPIQVKRA